MTEPLGYSLESFAHALAAFRAALPQEETLHARIFHDCTEWQDLLTYKLIPHLAGEGCLIVAVAGGTNTGKSTIFNVLCGRVISPVRATAAATCRPVLAANSDRAAQALQGLLLPAFRAAPLQDSDAIVRRESPEDTFFVAEVPALPATRVFLDTPDVDSIDLANWEVAENIRAAGDVLVAVLSAEKYKDDRVVQFFRAARNAGRIVLPLMNKANPADNFAAARRQLAEFKNDVGLHHAPGFLAAHDFDFGRDSDHARIQSESGNESLRDYLDTLNVAEIKARVFRDTTAHFLHGAAQFLAQVEALAEDTRRAIAALEALAAKAARDYDPRPGAQISGLFHAFMQSRRSVWMQFLGTITRRGGESVLALSRKIQDMLRGSRNRGPALPSATDLHAHHENAVRRIAADLIASCTGHIRDLPDPLCALALPAATSLEVAASERRILAEVLAAEEISEAFRAHAMATLDAWWREDARSRNMMLALDHVLLIAPTALAALVILAAPLPGVAETAIGVGVPVAEQVGFRVFEERFGHRIIDFVSPWMDEQRAALAAALQRHIVAAVAAPLRELLAALEGPQLQEMRQAWDQCRKASLPS